MVDRFRPGWRGTQLGEVQIMEVIFAAAAALARGGDMYAAVIGMWSSGQAGLALQRGEARGGRDGGKGGGRCETRRRRRRRRRRRPTRTHTCPPHRVRPSRQKDKNPAAELSLPLSFLSTSKTIFMAIHSATAAAMDFHIHEKKTGPSQTSLFEFVLRRGSGT